MVTEVNYTDRGFPGQYSGPWSENPKLAIITHKDSSKLLAIEIHIVTLPL